jgi:hypothetical protein
MLMKYRGEIKIVILCSWLLWRYIFLQLIGCKDLRYELGHVVVSNLMFRFFSFNTDNMLLCIFEKWYNINRKQQKYKVSLFGLEA